LSLARRQDAPDRPVTQLFGERVPGGWVDATLPRAVPIFGIAANADSKYDASTLRRWLIVRGWRGVCAECVTTAPGFAPFANALM